MAAPSPFDDVKFPTLSELPFRAGDPKGAIWGFYEHLSNSSTPDELGSLNLLTPARILKASQNEIKHGRVVSLNWELHKTTPSVHGRKSLEHKVFRMPAIKEPVIMDDELAFNTQSGSQWDGFKHYSHFETHQFYNGLHADEVVDSTGQGKAAAFTKIQRNGIQAFQGKIVGRGVLIDYYSWAKERGISFVPTAYHEITATDFDECIKAQGVVLEQGDILFVRMGFIDAYDNGTQEARESFAQQPASVGFRQAIEELQWLWDHHFAAIACDSLGFEVTPNRLQKWLLHDYLLPLWGTPIGELFDLEELSQVCKELGRYSFFVTSSPLNVVNGIASPPNALAIF